MSAPIRETPEQAGYKVVWLINHELLLEDESGQREIWWRNDGHASYGIRFANHDYEFVCNLKGGER